jgi:hypothetical protein
MARKESVSLFEQFKGYHYGYTDITRPREYLRIAKNIVTRNTEDVNKRPGFQLAARCDEIAGLIRYSTPRFPEISELYDTLLMYGNQSSNHGLYGLYDGYITITYSGLGSAEVSFLPAEDGNVYLNLRVNGANVSGFPKAYGTGLEPSYAFITDLTSDITAVTDFTATATPGSGAWVGSANPASCLSFFPLTPLPISTAVNLPFEYIDGWASGSTEIGGYSGPRTQSPAFFRNPVMVGLRDCVYTFLDQNLEYPTYGTVWKFDGLLNYKPGLPTPIGYTSTDSTLGSTFMVGDVYQYKSRLVRKDYRGNIVYSPFSEVLQHTVATSNRSLIIINLNTTGITTADGLKYSSTTTATTASIIINLPSGHPFRINDVITVYDTSLGTHVEAIVINHTLTTIALDKNVTCGLGTGVSNNVRVEVYRTKNGGNIFYYLTNLPTGASLGNTIYGDTTPDSSLTDVVIDDDTPTTRARPPEGSLAVAHQQLLVIANGKRQTNDPLLGSTNNRVWFSDVTGIEYFPPDTHYLDIKFSSLGAISGLASDGNVLHVFKEDGRAAIHGDLTKLDVFVDLSEDKIGCVSSDSIATGLGGVYFLSATGPQRLIDGAIDAVFQEPLAPLFENKLYAINSPLDVDPDKIYMRNAIGFYDGRYRHYHLYVPAYTHIGSGALRPNDNSIWYVYDELRDRWFNWTCPYHPLGGMAVFKNKLYFAGYSTVSGDLMGGLFRENQTGTRYDYVDHTTKIEAEVSPTWDHFGEPSQYKKFISIKTWSTDEDGRDSYTMYIDDYRNFDSTTKMTQAVQSYASGVKERRSKLLPGKTRAWSPVFRNNEFATGFRIGGFEVEAAVATTKGEVKN